MRLLKAFAFALILTVVTASAQAASLRFDPNSGLVMGNEPFAVDVVADLEPGEDLAGYFFDVVYDATVLNFQSLVLTDAIGELDMTAFDVSLPAEVQGDLGVINLSVESFLFDFSGQPDTLVLGTITFTAAGVGTSFLDFGDFPALDDPDLMPLSVTVTNGNLSAVPVPAAVWLLGVGLGGLGIFRRKCA